MTFCCIFSQTPGATPNTNKTPSRLLTPLSSLTPSAARGLRGSKTISASTPNKLNYGPESMFSYTVQVVTHVIHVHCMYMNLHCFVAFVAGSLSRSTSRSRIPIPGSAGSSRIPRPMSTIPGSTPTNSRRRTGVPPPRAQSVDPYKMSQKSLMNSTSKSLRSAERTKRSGSSRLVVSLVIFSCPCDNSLIFATLHFLGIGMLNVMLIV